MRFLLYNIRYATGFGAHFHRPFPGVGYLRRTHHRLDSLIEWFQEQDPDILGLVEVDMGSYRTVGKRNQAEMIADALGHGHIFECKYRAGSVHRRIPVLRDQGNAIITRHNIEGSNFHFSTHGIKRLIIELELEKLRVFLVHLSLRRRTRQHQLDFLEMLIRDSDRPVLAAGDFNLFYGERETQDFLAKTGLRSANPDKQPTYPSRFPRRELDFIFHDPRIVIDNLSIPKLNFSDHLPMLCDFHLVESD